MKTGTVEKILKDGLVSLSRPTLLKSITELDLDVKKTTSGENIFKWEHVAKIQFLNKIGRSILGTKVITICQNKGGVGKTTSTYNLATFFSWIGKTLVIDLDAQSNLTKSFEIKAGIDDITITDIFNDPNLLTKGIKKINDGLDLMPNHLKFDDWKFEKAAQQDKFILRKILDNIKKDYKFILIDTPPGIDISLYLSLLSSDYSIIPFEPDPYCLEGLNNILNKIEYISEQDTNKLLNLKMLGIFFTQVQKNSLNNSIIETMVEQKYDLFNTMIRKTTTIPQSQAFNKSIFDYDEKSPAATDYYNLGFEILNRILSNG